MAADRYRRADRPAAVALSLVTVLAIIVGIRIATRNAAPEASSTAQEAADPTPTALGACDPNVVCSEAAAIAVAMKSFPPGHNPHYAVARLLPYEIAINWRGGSTMVEPEGMPGPTSEPVMDPAWLVAILGDGMTVGGYSGMPSGGTPTPIGGMWYILMAAGGGLRSMGGLPDRDDPSGHMTYASILALESQPLDLTWRTPTPWPTLTPGLPPTSEFDLDEP